VAVALDFFLHCLSWRQQRDHSTSQIWTTIRFWHLVGVVLDRLHRHKMKFLCGWALWASLGSMLLRTLASFSLESWPERMIGFRSYCRKETRTSWYTLGFRCGGVDNFDQPPRSLQQHHFRSSALLCISFSTVQQLAFLERSVNRDNRLIQFRASYTTYLLHPQFLLVFFRIFSRIVSGTDAFSSKENRQLYHFWVPT
jgi:hypothetical protein